MARQIPLLVLAVLMGLAARAVSAAGDGQDDLDKATEAKLTADSVGELGDVIRLTESALKKGLDPQNTEFANKLLCRTLILRATEMTKGIFVNLTSADDFRERRKSILADLEKALKLDPKQSQAYLLIAQLNLLPEGAVKPAREALDKALELGIDEAPARAKALLLRAGLQENPEKKRADLDEAVRLMPDDAATVRARGVALAAMDKLEAALADLDKAIQLDPDYAAAFFDKATVLARQKKYEEALAALEKARRLSPTSVAPLELEARVHAQQEKPEAALKDLDQALSLDPNNLAVLMLRAALYEQQGEKEKALADVDRVLKIRPNLAIAIRTRALFLADSKRFDEAIAELEKLCKLDPKDQLAQLQLAMLCSIQKKSARAIEVYSAVLAEAPDEWRALNGRGDAYLNLGKHAEAIADYEKALKLHPKDESVLNNFAWVLATSPDAKLRDGKRAIELATEACEITEYQRAHILSTLAAAYAETGDFDSAIKWSSKAVELGDPQNDESLKKELQSYKAKKPMRERLSEDQPAGGEKGGEKGDQPKK